MKFEKKPLHPETFSEALIEDLSWLPESIEAPQRGEKLTEKAIVLESFTRFAEEKIAESPSQEIHFEGGSLALKEKTDNPIFSPQASSEAEWLSNFEKSLGHQAFQAMVSSKPHARVLFYVDELKESPSQEINASKEFLYCFESAVADLFEKMVKAMKLQSHDFALSVVSLNGSARQLDELMEEIYFRRPEFVVPLGAQATQALLGTKERLASIHGKFYSLPAITTKTIQVVPLFHPNVIATNQNMKKSTWTDMQKIMQALGLL